jgi:hypothetical protein
MSSTRTSPFLFPLTCPYTPSFLPHLQSIFSSSLCTRYDPHTRLGSYSSSYRNDRFRSRQAPHTYSARTAGQGYAVSLSRGGTRVPCTRTRSDPGSTTDSTWTSAATLRHSALGRGCSVSGGGYDVTMGEEEAWAWASVQVGVARIQERVGAQGSRVVLGSARRRRMLMGAAIRARLQCASTGAARCGMRGAAAIRAGRRRGTEQRGLPRTLL